MTQLLMSAISAAPGEATLASNPAQISGRRGVQNHNGFLTPYYLFDLLGRQHEEELDPAGGEPARRRLRHQWRQAQRSWEASLVNKENLTFSQTWHAWYNELFQTLGFDNRNLLMLDQPLETSFQGIVPVKYGYFPTGQQTGVPLILLDLHPPGTNLDRDPYPDPHRQFSSEPISRALEFVLDYNDTRWALLSNGVELRLYRKGGAVARQYLKIDFAQLFEDEDDKEWLVFWGLFRLAAFVPPEPAQRCLLERVIEESQRHAARIASDLRENVVRAVEALLQGVIDAPANRKLWHDLNPASHHPQPSEAQLQQLFDEAIYLLYRLLFVLYAESRNLLPVSDSPLYYAAYSLEHLRDMAERQQLRLEDYDKTYYIQTLRTLFQMLRVGYPAANKATRGGGGPFTIPPYNGQLFDPARTALLDTCHINDRAMREVILELSLSRPKHRSARRERYSYADLGVDQLGSIYEGLLVYEPFIAAEAMVEVVIKRDVSLVTQEQADAMEMRYNPDEVKPAGAFLLRIWGGRRKTSGSYYTPQEITAFLVRDALQDLVKPIIDGCKPNEESGKASHKPEDILEIKVCDPAMGSGAFLVQACRVLGEAYAQALLATGRYQEGRIGADELAHYKRRVAERCLYGVDLNPLAVELAKVSLWLETLARDRPLTFLDAHLRCGNSLIGAPLRNHKGEFDPIRLGFVSAEALGKAGRDENLKKLIEQNKKLVKTYSQGNRSLFGKNEELQILAEYERQRLELEQSDEDKSLEEAVKLVHHKQDILREAMSGDASQLRRLKQRCDLWCAIWFWPAHEVVLPPHTGIYQELIGTIMDREGHLPPENDHEYLRIAAEVARQQRFFHWELEFPEVWFDAKGHAKKQGGFDVIVGNPPWENIKPNSQEFWSNFLPTFRTLKKQAANRAANQLRGDEDIDKRWQNYIRLIGQQTNLFKLGHIFIQQGGGDVNTYKLFLEQFTRLTRVGGVFSQVVPSGIYTDEGCTPLRRLLFFRQRTRYLLSAENRADIFPIHRSTKVVLFSGQKTADFAPDSEDEAANNKLSHIGDSQSVACLFLVGKDTAGYDLAPSVEALRRLLPELDRRVLRLPAAIIKKLAPATLSLMEFKSQREIDLASKIYASHPLLGDKIPDSWNAPLQREFDMTNHSFLFNEKPVGWPLWEGKMIYQFTADYASPRYWVKQQAGLIKLTRKKEIKDYVVPEEWQAAIPKLGSSDFRLVYRKVARNTDLITLITTILPVNNFIGNSIDEFVQWEYSSRPQPTWTRQYDESNKLLLLGLLNSFVLNYLIRQKVSANLSGYLLGQLPVPRLAASDPTSQAIVPLAARLTCVDDRFAPLWNELATHHPTMERSWQAGCAAIDNQARAQLRAELDARVAALYGLDEYDFAYILSTFPLLDRSQPALPAEPKSFVTRDLALLEFFKLQAKTPPLDMVAFFDHAGVDISGQTGALRGLEERVQQAHLLGAVAYLPGGGRGGYEGEEDGEEEADVDEQQEETEE